MDWIDVFWATVTTLALFVFIASVLFSIWVIATGKYGWDDLGWGWGEHVARHRVLSPVAPLELGRQR